MSVHFELQCDQLSYIRNSHFDAAAAAARFASSRLYKNMDFLKRFGLHDQRVDFNTF